MIKDTYLIIVDFFRLVKGKTIWIIQLFISSIGTHIADLILPVAAANIIGALTSETYNYAYIWALVLGGCYIIQSFFLWWNYVAYAYNFKYCYTDMQNKIINKVCTYDEDFSKKISKGKIVNTCNSDLVESAMFIDNVTEIILLMVKLIVIVFVFLRENIYVGIAVTLLDLIYIATINSANKSIAKHLSGQRKYADKLTNLLSQLLTGLKEVKALNFMPKLNNKFDVVRDKWAEQYMVKRRYYTRRYTIIPNIVNVGKVILYITLIYLVTQKTIKIETLLLLISYFEMLIRETNAVLDYSLHMRNSSVSLTRMSSIINYKTRAKIDFGLNDNDYIFGLVEFNDVDFKYKNIDTLKKVSFKALPNEVTTIVGHSGSGKSTIVNLLLRLYKPSKGEITIDGESVYEYSKSVYSSNVTVVNQKPFIFNMSIRDNLSLVDSNRVRQENICKRIGIHDFIMSLPKGYNTVLKEDATDISGGQKQLLSLARALLSNAEILLFDEITSALDPQLVLHVTNLLQDLKLDHTIIMITHKPDLMEKADKIVVMDKGEVVGFGRHEELVKSNKQYIEIQSKEFISESPVKF